MTAPSSDAERWPELRAADWAATRDTLHMWTQIVGKVRLAVSPPLNHWWHTSLHVTSRGLGTGAMPHPRGGAFDAEFDFVDHVLLLRTSRGGRAEIRLEPRSVADFFAETTARLRELDVDADIIARPVEVADAIPFADDTVHASYDREAVEKFARLLVESHRVMAAFRGGFVGKASPVHFFWGGFDLAVTRFSGRPAPLHPGGIPNCPDWVMHDAYSHEVSSCGWWPGAGEEGFYYSYAYPEPAGFREAAITAAQYDAAFGEFLLPCEAVRAANDPDAVLLEFLKSTYAAAADLGRWDRAALEADGSLGLTPGGR